MKISEQGKLFIKSMEPLRLEAAAVDGDWTIGYGHTRGVRRGMKATLAEAESWFAEDLLDVEHAIGMAFEGLGLAGNVQNKFDALADFAFNVGADALMSSDLWRALCLGATEETVRRELDRWCYVGGEVKMELVYRRTLEANLFFARCVWWQYV
ncbi:MAG: lysozyme [Bacteroidales bacterium]|nr:lysozyme [Bacteroidales bacterium]